MVKLRKTISKQVGMALWARAAGRCEMCGEELIIAHAFDVVGNYAQVAHINAYSNGGARYREGMTPEELNDIDNLMLLCYRHHKMIDDHPDQFTEEMLRRSKFMWEGSIARFVENLAPSETIAITLLLPVGGMRSIITPEEMRDALLNEGLYTSNSRAFDCAEGVGESACLQDASIQIERRIARFEDTIDSRTIPISVFALAPQPLLIKLGSLLGGTRMIRFFQSGRAGLGWAWPEQGHSVDFLARRIRDGLSDSSRADMIIRLSGAINTEAIVDSPAVFPVFELTTPNPDIGIVTSEEAVGTFVKVATSLIDDIHEGYPKVTELHVYPAMPPSLAVAFGTALRFNLISKYVVHEKADGTFGETLCIGRRDG